MQYDARYVAEHLGDNNPRCLKPDSKGRYRINCPVHGGDGQNCLVWDAPSGDVLYKCPTRNCASADIEVAVNRLLPNLQLGHGQRKKPVSADRQFHPYNPKANDAMTTPAGPDTIKLKEHIPHLTAAEISGPWTYTDADGNNVLHVKFTGRNAKGKKQFAQSHWNKAGEFVKNKGLSDRLAPMYNLPEVAEFTLPVLITEGEKACHGAMQQFGNDYACTTHAGGRGKWHLTDWTPIAGREVVIWPDKETEADAQAQTQAQAEALAEHLHKLGCTVRIVDVSTVPAGYDLANPIPNAAELLEAAELWQPAPAEFILPEVSKKDLMAKTFPPLEWIVEGFIPQGVTLIAAPPKEGKTFFCEYLCDCMAGGRPWGEVPTKKQRILYIDAEQDEQLIQHRFKALGLMETEADLTFSPMPGFMFGGSPEKAIERLTGQVVGRYDMIVFDTFSRLFEMPRSGGDAYEMARQRIQPLHQWAKKHQLNVFVVHHTNKTGGKSAEEMDVMNLITGSNALLSVVDCGLVLQKHNDNEYKAHTKGRYFPGGVYSLKYNSPHWEFCGTFEEQTTSGTRKAILSYMRSAGGPCQAKEISEETGLKSGTVSQELKRMSEQKNPLLKKVSRGLYEMVERETQEDWHDVY